jgi:hypothetical protein
MPVTVQQLSVTESESAREQCKSDGRRHGLEVRVLCGLDGEVRVLCRSAVLCGEILHGEVLCGEVLCDEVLCSESVRSCQ